MCSYKNRSDINSQFDNKWLQPAPDIHEVCAKIPFPILVTCFSREPIWIHEQICMASDTDLLDCISKHKRKHELKTTVEGAPVHNKEIEREKMQTMLNMKVDHEDTK